MDIVLNYGEIVCIDGDARNLTVSCQVGKLWVTQSGDPNDYMLSPGENFIITRKGKIAVTAFDDARLRFTDPVEMKQSCLPWQVVTV
jgi:hypothetical protein